MIGTEWLLTAAHCTDGISAGSMYAGVHRHERTWSDDDDVGDSDCAETIDVAEKFDHPSYSSSTLENDISILRLQQEPACLSSIDLPSLDDGTYSQGGETCTVAGWGHTSDGGSSSSVLQSVDLTLLSNEARPPPGPPLSPRPLRLPPMSHTGRRCAPTGIGATPP